MSPDKTQPGAGETTRDEPVQLSKRKKQLENIKGQQTEQTSGIRQTWTQCAEDVTVRLKVDGFKETDVENLDVQFADTDVAVTLPDGRSISVVFYCDIERERSRVAVKKQTISLYMKKKIPGHWKQLETESDDAVPADTILPDPADIVQGTDVQAQEGGSDMGSVSGKLGTSLPDASTTYIELTQTCGEDTGEKFIKEEEPVVELQLLKHSFIEKDDVMVVDMYVKEVDKDSLMVNFRPDTVHIKFQTRNAQFLKLHKGSTEETKFSWSIRLKGQAQEDKCSFKVKPSTVSLTITKKVFGRWGDLEDLKRTESPAVRKSDDWLPLSNVSAVGQGDWAEGTSGEVGQGRGAGEETQPQRKVMFDEMRQNIERENLNQKPPDEGYSASTSKESPKKPTCTVQPLTTQKDDLWPTVSPGYTGLDNLGNTCFMNGVLQCLVNTREFRDFFLEGDFKPDLNTDNVLGSGGKLALSFAVLCKVLWSGKYMTYPPSKLKNLVAQKASQFTGFAQHDAQEFMAFLLDGLHEDLNRVRTKPYTETVEDRGRADDVVANEAWSVHKKRNNSFIVDLFQGQYKSKLVCPVCGKVSVTFDPFLYLSLPLPKRQRLLPVTFMWRDPYRKPVRYMLRLAKEATVEAMKEQLQKKTRVQPESIRVFEAYKGRIQKIFGRGASLVNVQANDQIIACEVLSEQLAGEPVYEVAVIQRTIMPTQFPSRCSSCRKLCPEGSKLKRCTKCLKVGYCDQVCQKQHWPSHKASCKSSPEPVGTPFIVSVPESRATFSKLCHLMESYARYSVEMFQPPVKADHAPKLTSHASSSNLSSSSQSSGSQTSLDSQSSFSSSCTITAEQEHRDDLGSPDICDTTIPESPLTSLPVNSDSAVFSDSRLGVCASESMSSRNISPEVNISIGDIDIKDKDSLSKPDIGYSSVSELNTSSASTSNAPDTSRPIGAEGEPESFTSPVRPVLGVQSGDPDRPTPMFYIKPVNSDGVGLTGSDGERLEDKGDNSLDLTSKFFLSIDWKNNDKLTGYVLIQSKEMEFDCDSSMVTASVEDNEISLAQCMELFTEPEVLSPEEAWFCSQCKEHREASKQLSTWRLPHTLIIQLKRFSFRNFIWRDKIDKMVNFPTRGLDLSSYYIGSRPQDEPPPIYDLYGVVNHHGGILGGHYTAFVRCAEKSNTLKSEVGWRLCDDSRVSSISHEKNVVTKSAYLLFYRRRQAFIPPPTASPVGLSDEDDEAEFQSAPEDHEEADNSSQNVSDGDNQGKLLTNNSPASTTGESDSDMLPDLDTHRQDGMVFDNDFEDCRDLGYTDMDSVD
ncbi:ubiquitin carboxyl-terminal hydrolase 19-like [Mya arenaria]|uniref:ubiquitin carboxyl-terminal hydrolase 19-like n=1 Tax=Mya arenaria TaxID=6604 RepID=UPI0022E2671A|nr:ubiquitin carboxyl-terminal hydrolase 19-like [Mya arenaria]